MYSHNPFRCKSPHLRIETNTTTVVLVIQSWSEAPGDTPNVFNFGRTGFTFATFVDGDSSAVSASTAPLDTIFDTITDPEAFTGACNLTAAAALAPLVQDVTVSTSGALDAGMDTPALNGLTIQATGCDCATLARMPTGEYAAIANCGAPPATASAVYWRAPNGWSLRQTTCGADAGDVCDTTTPSAYAAEGDSTPYVCSIRTEGVFVYDIAQSTTSLKQPSTRALHLVDLASTAAVGAIGVDVMQKRITYKPYSVVFSTAGVVVEQLAVGANAPPMLLSVQSTNGVSGGPSFVRCLVDSRTVRLVWQSNAYIQQRTRGSGTPPPEVPDTVLSTDLMTTSAMAPVWTMYDTTAGYTSACTIWAQVADGQPMPPGSESAYSCARVGATPAAHLAHQPYHSPLPCSS